MKSSKVLLTCNYVFAILLKYGMFDKNWEKAFKEFFLFGKTCKQDLTLMTSTSKNKNKIAEDTDSCVKETATSAESEDRACPAERCNNQYNSD